MIKWLMLKLLTGLTVTVTYRSGPYTSSSDGSTNSHVCVDKIFVAYRGTIIHTQQLLFEEGEREL